MTMGARRRASRGTLADGKRRYHHVIFVVDGDGNLVQDWTQHDKLFDMPCGRGPHKIKMSPYDPDKHVWVIDDQLHVIHKFTYEGELVMTLGTKGKKGRDAGKLFNRPTDIAWLPDGTFFISDGYGGKRVAKFNKDGTFIKDWGKAPADPNNPGPNEWNTVHSIAVSADRRVFVVDRGHGRIQIFDENGEFLDMFSTGPKGPSNGLCSGHRRVTTVLPLDHGGPKLMGVGRRDAQNSQIRPGRELPVRMGRPGTPTLASSAARTR